MIQAVILAGGRGMRLRPLTERLPKPMVPVHGRPFLEHQLAWLKSGGLTDVLLLVGYLAHMIEDYFGDGSALGLRIDYSHEETPLGTGGALKKAGRKLRADFLLLNGDTFLQIDYRRVIECYRARQCWALVVAYENANGAIPNNLALGDRGQVLGYSRQPTKPLTHVNAGVAVLSRRVLGLIPSGRFCSLEEEIYPALIARGRLWAYPCPHAFYDIGSFSRLASLRQLLEEPEAVSRSP